MTVLVRVINQATAAPADCSFVNTTAVAACSGHGSNAVLSPFERADILIFFALDTYRIIGDFRLFPQQKRFDHLQELLLRNGAAMYVGINGNHCVNWSCCIGVEEFCLVTVHGFSYIIEVLVVFKAVDAADGGA